MAAKKESPAQRKKRAGKILAELHRLYPDADCALHHKSALQLLVATILSAQSTDEMVNKVTPGLFARYPATQDLAQADRAELEEMIHSTGFFRQKAKSIPAAAAMIVEPARRPTYCWAPSSARTKAWWWTRTSADWPCACT